MPGLGHAAEFVEPRILVTLAEMREDAKAKDEIERAGRKGQRRQRPVGAQVHVWISLPQPGDGSLVLARWRIGGLQGAGCGAREALALPEKAFIFLFAFDFTSGIQRKNPWVVVHAFQKAFSNRADVHLVLKTTHGNTEPQALDRLRRSCAGCANVSFLDAVLDRDRMWSLLAACDAVVSLHRSEGFGLLLAEAMAMGKPTIATAYPANTDFMTPENSLLVSYRLVKNHSEWGPYARGAVWADPNINQAAALMRRLVDEPDLRERLGKRARQDMAQSHSQHRIGEIIRARLDAILSDGGRPSRATTHFAMARDMQRFAEIGRAVDRSTPERPSAVASAFLAASGRAMPDSLCNLGKPAAEHSRSAAPAH